ncbi:MAG TPA: RHS repeat-associated core domain-containing protein, partial [Gammaproteobacteria bacterium]|nr:RHS repeat-associated core domain-containing protein [Gammaproteobacteria bacterium]
MSPRNHNLTGRLLSTLLGLCLLLAAISGQAIERVTFYHNDALGSPVAATDASGTLLWQESYAPYGKRLTQEAGSKHTVWYTGKPEEAAFGLSYFGARWYDPAIGRFMAMDPVGFDPDNIHSFGRYGYGNGNPYAYTDPDGRNPVLAAGRAGWAIGGGLNALVYHTAGIALTTLIVDTAWNILHNESGGKEADNGASSKEGCIYCVKGDKTKSGKDYIGSTDNMGQRKKDKSDGRDREGAEEIDNYPVGDWDTRRAKEQ